jgi:hypothetical protein
MDKLEPIRRVFRSAGLYNLAADDLLCEQLAAVAAPQPQAEPAPNWCPECGRRPRDPIGVLGCRNGFHREEATPQPQAAAEFAPRIDEGSKSAAPQASAEDVALVDGFASWHMAPERLAAWQRIRADCERMGVK